MKKKSSDNFYLKHYILINIYDVKSTQWNNFGIGNNFILDNDWILQVQKTLSNIKNIRVGWFGTMKLFIHSVYLFLEVVFRYGNTYIIQVLERCYLIILILKISIDPANCISDKVFKTNTISWCVQSRRRSHNYIISGSLFIITVIICSVKYWL